MDNKDRTEIRESMISHGRLTELLHYNPETGIFTNAIDRGNKSKKGHKTGSTNFEGYLLVSIDGTQYFSHRVAWFYVHKKWPVDQIDHINRIRNDNRICNLREATHSINMRNRTNPAEKISGVEGIVWNKNQRVWAVNIKGKFICQVKSLAEAIKAKNDYSNGVFLKPDRRGASYKQSCVLGVNWDGSRNMWMVRLDKKFIGRRKTLESAIELKKVYLND